VETGLQRSEGRWVCGGSPRQGEVAFDPDRPVL